MSLIQPIPGMNVLKKGRRNIPRSLQPTPEAAKSRLARLRRKQLMQRRDLRHETLVQPKAIPPAPDPLGP
jgi:hypothetical protein